MRAVDTNILVRLVVRDDLAQARAAEETIWLLDAVYDRTAEQLGTAVDMLLNHKELTLQDAEVVTSALENFRARPALSFSDCLVLEIARKAGHLPLGTFDRDLAKTGGAHQLR